MFGIGVQEMVIVGVLFLVIFGPSKVPDMARDLGRFVNVARRSVEEFKVDLISEEDEPHKDRGQQASEELEASVRREDEAVADQSVPATK